MFGASEMARYAFDRMTATERRTTAQRRVQQGRPLHAPPHPRQQPGWYLVSAATYRHCPLFREAEALTHLTRCLLEALADARIRVAGWVVLPNHYHVLVATDELAALGRVLGRVHGRVSREANQRDGTPGRRVWYRYSDRGIRSERHFWVALHYLLVNPEKHGFCHNFRTWRWSCVHERIAIHGEAWLERLRRAYPVRSFGEKWDRSA